MSVPKYSNMPKYSDYPRLGWRSVTAQTDMGIVTRWRNPWSLPTEVPHDGAFVTMVIENEYVQGWYSAGVWRTWEGIPLETAPELWLRTPELP